MSFEKALGARFDPVDAAREAIEARRTIETRSSGPGDDGRDGSRRESFRADIQGLRAVSVLLVLAWHAGIARIPGGFVGVDVFFVISGFLITSLLVNEFVRTGSISLTSFYARRMRRILPAAGVVLAFVAIGTVTLLPKLRWEGISHDLIASSLYVENWRLAGQSSNYLAQGQAASPVQHFWSLGVEEQFYLIWPILMLAALWVGRSRAGVDDREARVRTPLLVGLFLVAAPSMVWSIYMTMSKPNAAFFVSTTRLWELALGGGVAIVAVELRRLSGVAAGLLAWLGVGAIGWSAVALSASDPYPGYRALLPVVGAAAVIAGGCGRARLGPGNILGWRPMVWIGGMSYSLYLWHWPLLVLARARWSGLTVWQSAMVACVSFIPAYLTMRLVENPVRQLKSISGRHAGRAIWAGVACTACAALLGAGVQLLVPTADRVDAAVRVDVPLSTGSSPASLPARAVGAEVLSLHPRDDFHGAPANRDPAMAMTPAQARNDVSAVYADGCQADESESAALSCTYGDVRSKTEIVVVGDSHAAQWVPALELIAKARHWKLVTYTKSACHFASDTINITIDKVVQPYKSCTTWNTAVLEKIQRDHPSLVVTSQITSQSGSAAQRSVNGMRQTWGKVIASGIRMLVIRDTPHPGIDVPDCLSAHEASMDKCAVDRSKATHNVGESQVEAIRGQTGVTLADLNDAICPTKLCAPVIGHVIVYRDANHITATYAKTLAPRLDRFVVAASRP